MLAFDFLFFYKPAIYFKHLCQINSKIQVITLPSLWSWGLIPEIYSPFVSLIKQHIVVTLTIFFCLDSTHPKNWQNLFFIYFLSIPLSTSRINENQQTSGPLSYTIIIKLLNNYVLN